MIKQEIGMSNTVALLAVLVFLTASCLIDVKPISAATQDSWTIKASMPTARTDLGVAVVNGKIFAIGGGNYGIDVAPVANEMYDPATDSWTTKASMPTGRFSFAIAVYQNKIYCIGGSTSEGVTGVNEVYDPETDAWETKTSMPTARSSLEANVVDGKIYLIGGSTGDYNLVSQNEVYDPETDTWSVEKRLPNPVQWYASAVVDNKIYVIGGYNYHVGMVNLTQVYEPATETWSMGAPIPLSLYGSAASTTGVLAPKRIYVIGGSTGIPFDGNFVYDPASDSWSRGADMPTARNGAGVAVVDDVLFVIGGDTSWYFAMLNANEQYTPYGYEPKPPAVTIFSPENKTYTDVNVSLTFMVNRPVVWIGFSLDGHDNVTIAGNTTLFGLSTGMHNVTVYAKDAFENTGNATINFTIAKVPEPFPVAPVATVSVATVAVVGMGLLIYFKKRKH